MYVMYILCIVSRLLTWSFSPAGDSHNYHVTMVTGIFRILATPENSVTSLYGSFRAEKLPYKAVTELWGLMQCCKDSAKPCTTAKADFALAYCQQTTHLIVFSTRWLPQLPSLQPGQQSAAELRWLWRLFLLYLALQCLQIHKNYNQWIGWDYIHKPKLLLTISWGSKTLFIPHSKGRANWSSTYNRVNN